MGTSVTWHVVSVPTSPGTSRHPPRPIRLAPVPILSVAPAATLSTISPFSALFTRCPVQGPTMVVRHHPTLNWTRRQYAGNFTEPLAHPHTHPASRADNGRRWFPRGARSDCALVNIGMPHRGTRNWMLLSIATWIAHTIVIDAVPSWFIDWFYTNKNRKLWLYTEAEKYLNDRDIICIKNIFYSLKRIFFN